MKKTVKLLSSVAVCSLLFISCEKESITPNIGSEETESSVDIGADQAVSGEYIIVYNNDTSITGKSNKMQEKANLTLSKHGIKNDDLKRVFSTAIQGFSVKNISEKQLELLENDPEIAYIEPNYMIKENYEKGVPMNETELKNHAKTRDIGDISVLPNGENLPWGVKNVGRKSGKGKKCWIIDGGIAIHDDLDIDRGNSKNFVEGKNSWKDEFGHGTQVAGIVAAKNNGYGVIGVAPGAKVVAVRVLDENNGGTLESVVDGIDYVAKNIKKDQTWNFSGGSSSRGTSDVLDDALKALGKKAKGAIAVANRNDNTKYYSPDRIEDANTFMVGAFNRKGNAIKISNFGKNIDFWAPGDRIYTTTLDHKWVFRQGTSFASPHVAAILLVNKGKVGENGTIKKGGHTAPKAKLPKKE